MPVFIIAEAGVNHDGSLDKALLLVDIATEAGADAVKFQTFRTSEVITPGTAKAAYQTRQTGAGDQYDMVRALELDADAHREIAHRCADRGIEFMSTPFERWALDLLISLGMKRIKIASGELTNKPLLLNAAERRLPIILSTGMATLDEVERSAGWVRRHWATIGFEPSDSDLTILHCTTDYPADPADINLRAMDTMRQATGAAMGYSDHSLGIEISVAAVARGACVIEKHFTLNPADPGPDHAASLEPDQLRELVRSIRVVEKALGNGVKAPTTIEIATRELVRRSAFARRNMARGELVTESDIVFRRPAGGIGPEQADVLFGSQLVRPIQADSMIVPADLAARCVD